MRISEISSTFSISNDFVIPPNSCGPSLQKLASWKYALPSFANRKSNRGKAIQEKEKEHVHNYSDSNRPIRNVNGSVQLVQSVLGQSQGQRGRTQISSPNQNEWTMTTSLFVSCLDGLSSKWHWIHPATNRNSVGN